MGKIVGIRQETHYRFLNFFTLDARNKNGGKKEYYMASRSKDVEHLKLVTGKNVPDGVTLYVICGETTEKVLLVRQYRYPVDGWVYEFPSGIIDPGESYREAAIREVREETGMEFHPIEVDPMYERARFQTVGMTDESCACVYGYATGEPSSAGEEEAEEIEVVLADKAEVRRILREEEMASGCAYHLAHFLHDDDPFAFLKG